MITRCLVCGANSCGASICNICEYVSAQDMNTIDWQGMGFYRNEHLRQMRYAQADGECSACWPFAEPPTVQAWVKRIKARVQIVREAGA
jgi:hypothetical protein